MKNAVKTIRLIASLFTLCLAQMAVAAPYLWTGTGANMNWNTTANWSPSGSPGYADTAIFGTADTTASATTVNNMVSVSTAVTTLNYTNSTSGAWHVTDIPAGVALTATNVTFGGINAASAVNDVALTDAGTFLVYSNLSMGDAGATANSINTVNFSGLSNFVYNASRATMNVGYANYSLVNFTMAAVSNNVTVGTINYNTTSSSSSSSGETWTLGTGTNIINVGTFNIAAGRNQSTVQFPAAGSTGTGLCVRGIGGTNGSLANLVLGYHNTSGSGSTAKGTLSLNGYQVDMQLGQVILGESDHTPTGASPGDGVLNFDTGTIYASNIEMSVTSAGNSDSTGSSSITVGANGTLIIGPGGLSLANQSLTSGSASGTLTINGGTVISSNNIFINTNGSGSISMNGGTLSMATGMVGTASLPIGTMNLSGGTLQLNVNGANTTGADVYGTSLSAGGMTITIASVANVTGPVTVHLISYNSSTSGDQFYGFTLAPLPAGYTGNLVDNSAAGFIDLSLQPAGVTINSLLWAGAVGSSLNSNWNFTTADWLNLTNGSPLTYTNPDFVYFDDSASNSAVTLTTNFIPGAFTFSNSVIDYTLSGPGSVGGPVAFVMDGYASVTLGESGGDSFTGGVEVNNGTVILDEANNTISGGAAIGNGATLQVGNGDAKGNLPSGAVALSGTLIFDQTGTDTVASVISGYGALNQNGTGRVVLTASDPAYTGSTTVNAGTLAVANPGAISNSPSVMVGTATLDFSSLAVPVSLQYVSLDNSALTVAMPGQQVPVNISSLNMGGSSDLINVTALPPLASYPVTLTLIQTAGGIGGYNMILGSLPAATPAYAGSVSESSDSTAVLLTLTAGPTSTRPSVLWVGTNNVSLTTNWSDRLNWQLPGAPTPADNVIFADDGSGSSGTPYNSVGDAIGGVTSPANFNNVVDQSFTIQTLTYTNLGGSSFAQNTLIANGASLNVAGTNTSNLTVGSGSTDYGAGATVFVTIAGTNSDVDVDNTNGVLYVGLGSANTGTEQATLDLSGLGDLKAAVSTFLVGVGSGSEAIGLGRVSGVVYLAQTNTITAGVTVADAETSDTSGSAVAFDVGDDDGNPGLPSALYLGQTNAIYADAIAVGRQKAPGAMQFNPNLANLNPAPSAYFRGASASAVANWSIGDQIANSGSGEDPSGTNDFTGGYVNALVDTMYVGHASSSSTGTGNAVGVLTFDDGIININTLYVGYQPTNSTKVATGTVNVNQNNTLATSGTLSVSGNFNLGLTATGGASAAGSLNIAGGTVMLNNVIVGANGATTTVSQNGGLLILTNTIGSSAAPLTTLTLQGGTLQLNPVAGGTSIVATTVSITGPTIINIASVSTAVGGAQQIPLINYTGTDPTLADLTVGTIPTGFSGATLGDDGVGHIYLSITAPPALVWAGALSGGSLDGNWNTADQNWLNGVSHVAYANPDLVTFNDTASTGTVTVAASVTPNSFTVANSVLNYVFNGTHAIGGTVGLVKSGTASLTLADSGGDNFSGGITVNGGAVVLDDAGSDIGGNVNITAGSVQLGNNDANGNLPGGITDAGTLIFDRSDPDLTIANTISGAGTIMQTGTNTVTLSGANSAFTGKVMITNGVLNVTAIASLGAAPATTAVTNVGSFDDNGVAFNGAGAPTLTVSGAGYNGAGAIINSGATQQNAFSNITLAASATFGGSNRWDIRASSGTNASLNVLPAGTPYALTKTGTNEIALVNVGTIDPNLGNILVQEGEFAVQNGTAQLGNSASNLVVSSGATLEMYGATTPLNKVITLNGNGTSDSFRSDADTTNENVVTGPVTLDGNCVFDISSNEFATFDNVISGPGGLTKTTTGILTLTNGNTYTGNTTVSGGTLVLSGSGSLASSNIIVSAGALLNAASRANQTLALVNGQTLGGFGTVTGLVTAASGSSVAPGSPVATGTLAFGNNVTLGAGSTNAMKVSGVSGVTNDVLNVTGTLALGGTLNVTSLGGTYVAGDSFKLFSATSITGAFTATNLPVLGGGLGWVTTNLANGILTLVSAGNLTPTNIMAVVNGNVLTLSWPGSYLGSQLQVQTNSLATGLNPNANAWFNVSGSTSVTSESITMDPKQGSVFYRLVLP